MGDSTSSIFEQALAGGGGARLERAGGGFAAAAHAGRADRRSRGSGRRCASSSRGGTPPARAARSAGLVAQVDPRHVRVVQFAAPTHDEKRHHFLWRFWPSLPGWGGMAVFDRSWYGRVLVERVEGLATREQWLRAYDEINAFERSLADEGTILIKFWLHISADEQLKRFKRAREGSAEGLEAHQRGLAQPREAGRVQAGRRGHGRPDRPRAPRSLAPDRGGVEALREGRGDRDRDPTRSRRGCAATGSNRRRPSTDESTESNGSLLTPDGSLVRSALASTERPRSSRVAAVAWPAPAGRIRRPAMTMMIAPARATKIP